MTAGEVERVLAITPQERKRLTATNVLPARPFAAALAYDAQTVRAIIERPPLEPEPPTLAVRLAEPADETDPDLRKWRRFSGWDASTAWTDQDRERAAAGIWQVKEAVRLIDAGATLLAVVAIVCVGAWRIVDGERVEGDPRKRWRFELAPHPQAGTFVGRDLRLGPARRTAVWL